jgi:tetratricopeptide (TPR) repeat protein
MRLSTTCSPRQWPELFLWLLLSFLLPIAARGQQSSVDYQNRGAGKLEQGDNAGALADLTQAIQLEPKNGDAYGLRGIAKDNLGDYDGAIADCTESIQLEPKVVDGYINRGLAKVHKGDFAGGIADYNQAIQMDPRYTIAYDNRANTKENMGDYDGAIADYNQAIQLDPNFAAAYSAQGIAKQLKGDYAGAFADYNKAVQLNSRSLFPYLYLWVLRVDQGKKVEANRELASRVDSRGGISSGDWSSQIAGFLLDRITETDLFNAARSQNVGEDRVLRCEAWYFAAMKRLLGGDKKTAGDYFRKCLATEAFDARQYGAAQAELKTLTK